MEKHCIIRFYGWGQLFITITLKLINFVGFAKMDSEKGGGFCSIFYKNEYMD